MRTVSNQSPAHSRYCVVMEIRYKDKKANPDGLSLNEKIATFAALIVSLSLLGCIVAKISMGPVQKNSLFSEIASSISMFVPNSNTKFALKFGS